LACSDHRFQGPLRALLAGEGVVERSELLMWPGGASALGGPDAGRVMAALETVAGERPPARLLLVAHQGCRVPGAYVARARDPFRTRRLVTRRRRLAVGRVRRRLGLEPELWFLSVRGARRVAPGGAVQPRPGARPGDRLAGAG
ncbi:MAG: hypothetical protein HY658_12790, partial [Actinobacteria bacterium]|nr:hypothetical protein [Actinomycetota bacterium]